MDFLSYWADENYGKMAASLVASDGETKQLGDLHRKFEHLEGQSFERVDIDEMARAQRTITVTVEIELFEEMISAIRPIAVTRVDVDGRPAVPRYEGGSVTITNYRMLTTL